MNDQMKKMKNREMVKAALQALADANSGQITPELVVQSARSPSSPLHGEFTWDVQEAAAKHWLNEARVLIQSVRLEIKTENIKLKVPAYLRDTEVEPYEQGYVSLSTAKSDEDRRRDVLIHEFMRLRGYVERVRGIAAAFGQQAVVDDILRQVNSVLIFGEQESDARSV